MRYLLIGLASLALAACGSGDSSGPVPLTGTFPAAGPEFEDPGSAVGVVLETELGNIHIDVFTDRAPKSSADFLYYVDKGLYSDQGFYRVVTPQNDTQNMDLSIIQGGRLDLKDLTLVPEHESTQKTGFRNVTGSLALARGEVGSASAAFFFINLDDNKVLNHGGARNPDGQGFAVFGRVTQGLEVAYHIQQQMTSTKEEADLQPPEFALMGEQLLKQPVFITRAYRK